MERTRGKAVRCLAGVAGCLREPRQKPARECADRRAVPPRSASSRALVASLRVLSRLLRATTPPQSPLYCLARWCRSTDAEREKKGGKAVCGLSFYRPSREKHAGLAALPSRQIQFQRTDRPFFVCGVCFLLGGAPGACASVVRVAKKKMGMRPKKIESLGKKGRRSCPVCGRVSPCARRRRRMAGKKSISRDSSSAVAPFFCRLILRHVAKRAHTHTHKKNNTRPRLDCLRSSFSPFFSFQLGPFRSLWFARSTRGTIARNGVACTRIQKNFYKRKEQSANRQRETRAVKKRRVRLGSHSTTTTRTTTRTLVRREAAHIAGSLFVFRQKETRARKRICHGNRHREER